MYKEPAWRNKDARCESRFAPPHPINIFLPCFRGLLFSAHVQAYFQSLGGRSRLAGKLPMDRLISRGPKNRDFRIFFCIWRSAACGWYFRDLLAWFECTHSKTYKYAVLGKTNGVAPLDSDAWECTKKMQTTSLKIHLLLRFMRWNSVYSMSAIAYAHISGFEWNPRGRPTRHYLIPEFSKKVPILQNYNCKNVLIHV